MPTVVFTENLKRHLSCPPRKVAAATLREALDQVFAEIPRLRDYILDDQDRLRQHVVVFIDGEQARDRERLSDQVRANAEIYVMQALSGG